MNKRIAVLLNGQIKNDYRVIKMIQTISQVARIDLFYINGDKEKDQLIFNSNVVVHPIRNSPTFYMKFLRHSFFCYEFNFMIKPIINTNVKYDYIWANDLPTLYPAFRVAKNVNAKLIYDSHEIFVETINQFFPRNEKGIKGFFFRKLIYLMRSHGRRIEKQLIPECDKLITVNESLMSHFKSLHQLKDELVIMNLPRLTDYSENRINFRREFSWESTDIILLYQGGLNEGRGLSILLKTLHILPEQYKLVIIGDGPLKKPLIEFTVKKQMNERIKFIDSVPLKSLPYYTKGADLGVNLLETFNLSKQLASPNKLFEYIHSGLPVIASNTIENARVILKHSVGVLINNDCFEIKETIMSLNHEKLDEFKRNCVVAKQVYNWESQVDLVLSIVV